MYNDTIKSYIELYTIKLCNNLLKSYTIKLCTNLLKTLSNLKVEKFFKTKTNQNQNHVQLQFSDSKIQEKHSFFYSPHP